MYREAAPAQPDPRPRVSILEQPASKALRFRYECEGRSAGSIPGARSTPERKTFPTIEITGHRGRAVVVVSCVTKDEPYRPHPHNLVGRELCKKGVCTVNVGPESPVVQFSNLGIQCVKRRDIEEALRVREEMRVDPFKTGFSHKSQPQLIDLNAVRLCFQVFLQDAATGKIRHALQPVVSDVIYDKKAMSDLVITRLSHCSAPVTGGKQVILLCEKVAREDIAVTFFEKNGEQITWQADAVDVYVHKQVAICFSTPRYRDPGVTTPINALVQLRRPTDNATSDPLPFELLPATADPNHLKRKRQKPLSDFSRFLQPIERDMNQPMPEYMNEMLGNMHGTIKLEPRDKTPPHPLTSPRAVFTSPTHSVPPDQYAWNLPGDMGMPGPSHGLTVPGQVNLMAGHHINNPFATDMWANTIGQAVSPIPQALSPNMGQAMSPNVGQAMSPNMGQAMSPNMGQAMSPNMGQAMSPNMGQAMSPMRQMSPLGQVSPDMEHVGQQQANMVMLQQNQGMDVCNDAQSYTEMLLERGPLTSGDLAGLSGLSGLLNDTISDSLTRLPTEDLLRHTDHQN